VRRAFEASQPAVVLHTAALIIVNRKPVSDDLVRAVNVGGTRLLLDEAQRRGVRDFVYTSSAGVVQTSRGMFMSDCDESMHMVTEDDPVDEYNKSKGRRRGQTDTPHPPYPPEAVWERGRFRLLGSFRLTKGNRGSAQAEAERLVLAADDDAGMRTCAIRVTALYGEYDNDQVPGFMQLLREGRQRIQIGSGNNKFSWLCKYTLPSWYLCPCSGGDGSGTGALSLSLAP
jgi:sterol-4alpha-carboxylate 3-dehydrogenase (decarboxylating)